MTLDRRGSYPAKAAQLVGIAALVAIVWALSDVVLVLFFAILIACVLHGVAAFIAKRTGMREGFALAVVSVGIALAGLGIAGWIVPELMREGQDLLVHLDGEWAGLRRLIGLPAATGSGGGIGLGVLRGRLAEPMETMLGSSLSVLAGSVVVIVTAIYLAANPLLYVRGALHLVPFGMRPRLHQVMRCIGKALRLWVLGQLVDMVVVGVLSGAGMWLLGVPAPFALAVLSALLTFIPYFGAILAAVPATLVALTVGWETALWALGVYTLCHCVEGYLIAPIVQRRMVDLPPALTVMSMTVAGALFGILGLTLGTPLAAAGLIAVRMLYVEDALGDDTVQDAMVSVDDAAG